MTTQTATPNQNESTEFKTPRLRRILMIGVPVLVLLIIGIFYMFGGRYIETDDSYVRADKVPVSAQLTGVITEVLVSENQAVKKGQPLFRIDSEPLKIAVQRAQAKLDQVQSDVSATKASYQGKLADIKLAQTKQKYALKNQHRQASLIATSATSAADLDNANLNAEMAAQQIASLNQDLKRINATLGGNLNAPVESLASYRAAKAELEQAQLNLSHAEIVAAQDGVISNPPKVGQFVNAGATTMALVVGDSMWVEANVTETDLTYIHPGQSVEVSVDTYPDQKWLGEVDSISLATGSEFSLIPAQNATGNWVKVAQRVPVKIKLLPNAKLPQLRSGLSAVAVIDTQHRRQFLGMSF